MKVLASLDSLSKGLTQLLRETDQELEIMSSHFILGLRHAHVAYMGGQCWMQAVTCICCFAGVSGLSVKCLATHHAAEEDV